MTKYYHFWLQKAIEPSVLYEFFKENFNHGPLALRMVSKRTGVIEADAELAFDLSSIAPILSNDLGSGIVFVVSPIDNDIGHRAVLKARKFGTGVYELADVIFLLIFDGDYSLVNALKAQLEGVSHDLINTADMFVKCGLNASRAADKLYIHRNTFNYRLQNFINITDLDIRDYPTAQYYQIVRLLQLVK